MAVNPRSSAPDWLFRTLQRAGLRVESGATPSSLMIRLEGSRPTEFDVLRFPVLSLERAQQIVESARSRNPEARVLLAIRQLSDRTREMLRAARCSWAEELTGIVHVVGPGLFVNVNRELHSEGRRESEARARLRDRSGLLAEALLTSPAREKIDLRTLAARAHASSALASRVL